MNIFDKTLKIFHVLTGPAIKLSFNEVYCASETGFSNNDLTVDQVIGAK